jgi:DNA-binding CsgD family transcriptional regulator
MSELFAPAYGRYDSLLGRIFGPLVAPNAYLRLIHLAAMFPLGLAYFVTLVVAGAVGGSLIWTFVGPVILIIAMFLSRWAGDLEAYLVHHVAQVDFRRPPTRLEPGLTWRQQLTTRLIDPSTWTGLVYLMVQFPVGIGMFVAITVLGTVAFAFMGGPLVIGYSDPVSFELWREFTLDTPWDGALLIAPGIFVFIFMIHFVLVASSLHARWARLMLGSRARTTPSPEEVLPPAPVAPEPVSVPAPAPTVIEPTIVRGIEALALPEPLTAREGDVLGLLAFGYSNADIAETLVLSEGTVKTHVKRVLAKLDVHNRTEAALYARDHSIVYSPPVSETPVVPLRRQAP